MIFTLHRSPGTHNGADAQQRLPTVPTTDRASTRRGRRATSKDYPAMPGDGFVFSRKPAGGGMHLQEKVKKGVLKMDLGLDDGSRAIRRMYSFLYNSLLSCHLDESCASNVQVRHSLCKSAHSIITPTPRCNRNRTFGTMIHRSEHRPNHGAALAQTFNPHFRATRPKWPSGLDKLDGSVGPQEEPRCLRLIAGIPSL